MTVRNVEYAPTDGAVMAVRHILESVGERIGAVDGVAVSPDKPANETVTIFFAPGSSYASRCGHPRWGCRFHCIR